MIDELLHAYRCEQINKRRAERTLHSDAGRVMSRSAMQARLTASLDRGLLRPRRGVAAGAARRRRGPVDDVRRHCGAVLELLQDLLDLVAAVRQLRPLLVDVVRRRQPLLELGRVGLQRHMGWCRETHGCQPSTASRCASGLALQPRPSYLVCTAQDWIVPSVKPQPAAQVCAGIVSPSGCAAG